MKRLYLVRHCKALGQAPDAQLSPEGERQAQSLCSLLDGRGIDYVMSSPFVRAVQSINPFAKHAGLPIQLDDRLSERVLSAENLPDWEARLCETFDNLDLAYTGGESSRTATVRAVKAIDTVLAGPQNSAVVVTHGNLMTLLLKHFDDTFGFQEWHALTNPDVFLVRIDHSGQCVERIWS